jgi:hypothetical protein
VTVAERFADGGATANERSRAERQNSLPRRNRAGRATGPHLPHR